MREFPVLVAAFAAGRLSYSKVRAITRIATEATVATLVDWGEHATAAQIEQVSAAQRRVTRARDVRARKAARQLSYRWDDDGSLVGSFRLPPEDGGRFLQALQIAVTQLPEPVSDVDRCEDSAVEPCDACSAAPGDCAKNCPNLPRPERQNASAEALSTSRSPAKSRADALVAMAEQTLTAAQRTTDDSEGDVAGGLPGLGADRFQLVIHVPAPALRAADSADDHAVTGARISNGPQLHPSIARRISCGCRYATQTDDPNGNPLHLGRATRRIRGRLARAVHHRDHGHCQAPGCTNPTTEIHHIQHWANGGPTCLTNLISLCDSHHWLVHEGGWSITGHSPATWTFHTPDGRAIRSRPEPVAPAEPLPHNPAIAADAITGQWTGERLDINDALLALSHLDRRNERRAQAS